MPNLDGRSQGTGGRLWAVLLLLGACCATVATPAAPGGGLDCTELADLEHLLDRRPPARSHFVAVEELFHDLLLGWPGNGARETAAGLSRLEQRLAERLECLGGVRVANPEQVPKAGSERPGSLFLAAPAGDGENVSPFVCLAVIEGRTFRPIFGERPETLLAIARLYQHKHAYQLERRQPAFASRSLEQVETLLAAYAGATGEAGDAASAATILALATMAMTELRVYGITEDAVAVLDRALEIDPRNQLALYLAARSEEKLARYRDARGHLQRLHELRPDDTEVELRLAIQLARTGAGKRARQRLAGLVGGQPDWVAIVAAQELGDLLVEDGATAAAGDVLSAALERFPSSSQLRLQLAQTRHDDWQASWPLVDRVLNGWSGDPGEPARVEYEKVEPQWIRDEAAALDGGLLGARTAIVRAAAELRDRSDRQKRADSRLPASLCHGTLPLRWLPGDEGPGPFAPGSPGFGG